MSFEGRTRHGREWAILIAAGIALEAWALRKPEIYGTLSCQTRKVLGIDPPTRLRHLGRVGLFVFLVWFGYHIAFEANTKPIERT